MLRPRGPRPRHHSDFRRGGQVSELCAHTDNVARRHGICKGGKEGRAYEQVTGCMQAARSDSLSHSPLSHLASKRGAPAAENGKQCNKGAKTRPISHLITHDASDSESWGEVTLSRIYWMCRVDYIQGRRKDNDDDSEFDIRYASQPGSRLASCVWLVKDPDKAYRVRQSFSEYIKKAWHRLRDPAS